MYGHGSSSCHLKAYCAVCAENHITKDCKNDVSNPKCAGCSGNHLSTDPGCPNRNAYINKLSTGNNRFPRNNLPTRNTTTNNNININSSNFPHLPNNKRLNSKNLPNTSYSNVCRNYTTHHQLPDNDHSGNILFTFVELQELLNDMITRLSACKTKIDQFNVISELSLKYLFNAK